jgi:hypothetical protein
VLDSLGKMAIGEGLGEVFDRHLIEEAYLSPMVHQPKCSLKLYFSAFFQLLLVLPVPNGESRHFFCKLTVLCS